MSTRIKEPTNSSEHPKCGIVMPIASYDGCTAEHWSEVLTIIKEGVALTPFEPKLVSESEFSGIIHQRIIQNLYSNEIVVCDVSGRNPNVMFELGMRLAFDKPTIIIKDDNTDFAFDTGIIEHLTYPRDLHFHKIVSFKSELSSKIVATHKKATEDPNYTTFLKNFGEYKVAQLDSKNINSENYILDAMQEIKYELAFLRRNRNSSIIDNSNPSDKNYISTGPSTNLHRYISPAIADFLKIHGLKSTSEVMEKNMREELMTFLFNHVNLRKINLSYTELSKFVDQTNVIYTI